MRTASQSPSPLKKMSADLSSMVDSIPEKKKKKKNKKNKNKSKSDDESMSSEKKSKISKEDQDWVSDEENAAQLLKE